MRSTKGHEKEGRTEVSKKLSGAVDVSSVYKKENEKESRIAAHKDIKVANDDRPTDPNQPNNHDVPRASSLA